MDFTVISTYFYHMNIFQDILPAYIRRFPDEDSSLQQMKHQELDCGIFDRSNLTGHVTASALLLSDDLSEAVLILHKKYQKWIPPGGHVDANESTHDAALREMEEEIGVDRKLLCGFDGLNEQHGVIDIDTHAILANPKKAEGSHFHHDVMHAWIAPRGLEFSIEKKEVDGVQWVPIETLLQGDDLRMKKIAQKVIQLQNGLELTLKNSNRLKM